MRNGSLKTLVVDDDDAHTRILREAVSLQAAAMELASFTDGDRALAHLRESGCELPDLIIMDLDMPGRDGCSMIEEIRRDARLRLIPVMVLSGTTDESEIERAYGCGANLVFSKPADFDRYLDLVSLIVLLWTQFAVLPRPI